jgi:uncharacterized membrane protein HdeD (DUF308 family)
MIESMVRNWWVFVVRGILAILFGVLAFARPDITLVALVALFGTYALFDGILNITSAFMFSGSRYFWWVLLDGILGIAVGVMTFMHPGAIAASLLILLGIWLIVTGLFRIFAAIELRKVIDHEWAYIISGLLSVAVGVLTVSRPGQSALGWLWVIGTYAVLYGVILLVLGFKMKTLSSDILSSDSVAQG